MVVDILIGLPVLDDVKPMNELVASVTEDFWIFSAVNSVSEESLVQEKIYMVDVLLEKVYSWMTSRFVSNKILDCDERDLVNELEIVPSLVCLL
ncbi:hypothetical protein NDU88_001883 [Pleurodeles waltl]|uniref:Uncharacterized protein n=1 Tax=Pleurodeles waltl TaxID=8319 RepID=A0AAV7Q546_PLEWA|nr:hypothetical protein NDU88_001883 [Pleurodeles waltl]